MSENDCPEHIITVRRDENGALDEIVAENCTVHLEDMGNGQWWLGVYKDGFRQAVWLTAKKRGVMSIMSEMDDWPAAQQSSPPHTSHQPVSSGSEADGG